ncbi:MAG TPA: hypothetical protein VFB54_15885 [Burkholderiales bacterium]|nr:hypothetical protein [Burkholderiales bacterium]
MNDHWDLARDLLDHELVDSHGVPCGRVDDIELEACSDGTLRITALLSGPGARSARLPGLAQWLVRKIGGSTVRRVPWSEVAKIDTALRLRRDAQSLGLNGADRRLGRWIAKLPKS